MGIVHPLSPIHHVLVLGTLLVIGVVDPPSGPFPVLGGLISLYGVVLVLVQFWGWWIGRRSNPGNGAGGPAAVDDWNT